MSLFFRCLGRRAIGIYLYCNWRMVTWPAVHRI